MYNNRLLRQAATMHYVHGIPTGDITEILGGEVSEDGLIGSFHRLGQLCMGAQDQLIDRFRKTGVKHADETGWRTDGHSGWSWIFTTRDTSIFKFCES
jgi:hypothetical protein